MIMKIYARTNDSGIVIKLFSDVREAPTDSDLLIEEGNQQYHAHVHLKYELMKIYKNLPFYKYKIVDNEMVERDDQEFEDEMSSIIQPSTIEDRLNDLEEAITQIVFGGESTYVNK